MNILILSAGTRNKIVQYFKNELKGKGKVVATDNSPLAPAIYDADKHYLVPRINDPKYLDIIMDICERENIKGIFSLIDPELELLAKNREVFTEKGITPIISNLDVVKTTFSKYEMYLELTKHNIPTIKTYNSLNTFYTDLNEELISFPVFVKPNKGSASKGVGLVETKEDLELRFRSEDDLIIQEYMTGYEYGADVYVDLIDNKPKALFLKKKLLMRAGETDKSVSLRHKEIENMIFEMLKHIPFVGIIDVDIFEHNNEFYISEVNPRFGGGYPHGYEIGINIPKMIINNLEGKTNDEDFNYKEETYMMKYNEISIVDVLK